MSKIFESVQLRRKQQRLYWSQSLHEQFIIITISRSLNFLLRISFCFFIVVNQASSTSLFALGILFWKEIKMCVINIKMNAIISALAATATATATLAPTPTPTPSAAGIDPSTVVLIITQAVTFVLLVTSEILPVTSPYNSIIQAIVGVLTPLAKPQTPPVLVVAQAQ